MQDFFPLLREQGARVAASTEKQYLATIRRMEKSEMAPTAWLKAQVTQLDSSKKKASRMTLGVYRSAVSYYLQWQHYERTGEVLEAAEAAERFKKKLVAVASGQKGEQRGALTVRQYETYVKAVLHTTAASQIQAVLLLLPLTGMRISEACGLKGENVLQRGDEWTLSFRGKGDKHRTVPLSSAAQQIVEPFLEGKDEDDYLFENPCLGLPGSTKLELSPAQVRAEVRDQIQTVEGLEDVTPHILRHHFSTAMIRSGADIFTAKELLGHSSLKTMERYMHPDEDMKRKAVEGLGKLLT